jgi:hypothetical protein
MRKFVLVLQLVEFEFLRPVLDPFLPGKAILPAGREA